MNIVSPLIETVSGVILLVEFPVKNGENDDSIGDAGGEIGHGGRVWVHETEIGVSGSSDENEIELTFVLS